MAGAAGPALSQPARATQLAGARISSSVGSHSGPCHTRASSAGPAGRLDRLDEALALGVLAHLGLEPEQLLT